MLFILFEFNIILYNFFIEGSKKWKFLFITWYIILRDIFINKLGDTNRSLDLKLTRTDRSIFNLIISDYGEWDCYESNHIRRSISFISDAFQIDA